MSEHFSHCPACLSKEISPYLATSDHRVTSESFELLRCVACGLVITSPQPGESEIGRYYQTDDYISHASRATSFMDKIYYGVRQWMARRKKRLVTRLAPARSLVDIGAGTGFFAAFMQKAGWQVKAYEPSAGAREIASATHKITLEDIGQLFLLPQRSVSIVTMWHVLEHVHQPSKYLETIEGILSSDGVFLLALPNYQSVDARFYQKYWAAWDVPRHLWHFSPESVISLLDRHGFRVTDRYAMPFDAFYVSLVSEKYRGSGLPGAVRALFVGLWSNLRAWFNTSRASSIIYVAVKKDNPQSN